MKFAVIVTYAFLLSVSAVATASPDVRSIKEADNKLISLLDDAKAQRDHALFATNSIANDDERNDA